MTSIVHLFDAKLRVKMRTIDLYRGLFKVQVDFQLVKNQGIKRGDFGKSLYLP